MSEELYLRLFREVNAARYDSRDTGELLDSLGAPALLFRAYARARCHDWGSVQDDLAAALADTKARERDPRLTLLTGVCSLLARDYDRGLVCLREVVAASRRRDPKLAAQALELGLRHASALAWTAEARELRAEALELRARRDRGAARARLEREREQRAAAVLASPPELAAQRAYALAFQDGLEAARALLERLDGAHPGTSAILGARLRLALLGDRLEDASAIAATLDEDQQKALRGELAALALAWGDADAALRLTEDPGADPRLLHLRGRVVLELFEDAQYAAESFEAARRLAPRSPVITLAQTLARHRQHPRGDGGALERNFELLVNTAPALLADAAASLGARLWGDRGLPQDRDTKVAILARAYAMLSAELDLELPSYARRSGDGVLRLRQLARSREGGPTHLELVHSRDEELLERYEAELVRVIGVRPPRPAQAVEPESGDADADADADAKEASDEALAPRRLLSAAQIEQFLADGYIMLPRAIDPERIARMQAAALERLYEAPDKWVKGYEHGPSLDGFDHLDPTTWKHERIDLLGPESYTIESLSAELWAAICDLLGGPARIDTRGWGDYLILNLCADDPLVGTQPPPGAASWHIDDPNPVTRLDRIRNGLLCIVLFDEVRPASGNTWCALDSVARVARELAAHPEGVDFVHDRGNHITAKCERFYSVSGQAGDVWLIHPLMMHSASPNRSGRIRWMANPMVYVREPLDPFREPEQLSPVELAIRRAIDGGEARGPRPSA